MKLIFCQDGGIILKGKLKHDAPLFDWLEQQLGGFVKDFYKENKHHTVCKRGIFTYDMVNHVLGIVYTPKGKNHG